MEDKSTTPKTGPRNNGVRRRVVGSTRKLPIVLGAIGLASLLLLALTMNAGLLKKDPQSASDDTSIGGSTGGSSLQSLPHAALGNASLIDDALLRMDSGTTAASQAVLGAISGGDAGLAAAIGDTAGLPSLPNGYTGGVPDVGIVHVPEYNIASFGSYGLDSLSDVGPWGGTGVPVLGRDGLVLPQTGNPEIDDALAGLAATLEDLDGLTGTDLDALSEDALADSPLEDLGLPGDELGLPTDGLGLPTDGMGLPTDGLGLPTDSLGLSDGAASTVAGSTHTLNPDEEGASTAYRHGQALLSTATGSLARAQSGLDQVTSTQGQLVASVKAELARADAVAAAGHASLDEQAEARIQQVLAQAESTAAAASANVDGYLAGVAAAHATAQGNLEDAVTSQTTALQGLSAHLATDLEAEAAAILSQAAQQEAEIDAAAQQALDVLAATPGLDSVEQANRATVIHDTADALKQEIAAEADRQAEILATTSIALQQSIQGTIEALVDAAAHANLLWDDSVDAASAHALEAAAYAAALAQATGDARAELLEDGLPNAHRLLDLRHTNHLNAVAEAALGQNAAAGAVVDKARQLAGSVGLDADAAATQDIEYILGVAQQYGDQMMLDTDKREEYWATAAATLDGALGGVLVTSADLLQQADAADSIVNQTRAQLTSTLGLP